MQLLFSLFFASLSCLVEFRELLSLSRFLSLSHLLRTPHVSPHCSFVLRVLMGGLVGEFLFGKRMTPEEYVKKWKRDLNKEKRELERNIRGTPPCCSSASSLLVSARPFVLPLHAQECPRGDCVQLSCR